MSKKVKILGLLLSIASFGISILSDRIEEQKMEEEINRQIDEKLAERLEGGKKS